MHLLQFMIEGMNAELQRERATTQMTLGVLIHRLEELPPDMLIDGVTNPHSYRGYYCDLAFEPFNEHIKASELLTMCKLCMGKVFQGYKGGDYLMDENTPVWLSEYGTTGMRIMNLTEQGHYLTAEDN